MYTEEAKQFLAQVARLGIDPSTASGILGAYDALSGPAKEALPAVIQSLIAPAATLRDALAAHAGPVNVFLVDRDGNRHAMPPIEKQSTPYLAEEEWLLQLPLVNPDVLLCPGSCVDLWTELSAEELTFLGLTELSAESLSGPMHNLALRADMANAGFSDKLSYLMNGTSFERSFNPEEMDVVYSSERAFLCDFLQDYTELYVRSSPEKDGIYYIYGIMPDKEPVDFDLLGIKLKQTEPGKGLTNTVAGKCAWAEHRAKKARAEVMDGPTQSDTRRSSGKEILL